MVPLDLDDDATWVETYKEFLNEDPYGLVIDAALSQKTDKGICKIFGELKTGIEFIESGEHLSFRYRLTEIFKRTYADVVAYHACRPKNVDSYYDKGIIFPDQKNLIEEIRIFFKDFKDIEAALECFKEPQGQSYLNHGRSTIGFFMSKTDSLEGDRQFLEYGSEIFLSIANRLGEKERALQKLSDQGTPILIRCRVPVSWLDEYASESGSILENYIKSPLEMLLERLAYLCWPERSTDYFRGAFLLEHSLPKEQILSHIDMTSKMRKN